MQIGNIKKILVKRAQLDDSQFDHVFSLIKLSR